MKKKISVIMSLLLICSMLGACGSDNTEENKGNDTEQAESQEEEAADQEEDGEFTEEVTLDVAMMWSLDSTTDAKSYALNNALKRLEKDYPNITINYDGSVHDDYQTIMMTYAAADTLPDVFNVKGSWIPGMVENGQLGTIDEFLEQDKEWGDGFSEDMLFDMKYDGHYYGAPFQDLCCSLIVYNKEIYDSVGYDHFPEDWDELLDCFTKLKDAGYVPLGMGNSGQWVANSCMFGAFGDRGAGNSWYDDIMNGTGDGFLDENMLHGVEKMAELAEKGFMNSNMNSIDQFEVMPPYINEEYASYVDGSWTFGTLIATAGDDQSIVEKSGVAVFPTFDGAKGEYPATPGGSAWGQAYNANLTGAKKEAARIFIKYISDEQWCLDLAEKGDFGGQSVDYDYGQTSPILDAYVSLKESAAKTPQYDCHFNTSVIDAINTGFQELLLGEIDAKEWGKRVQDEYEMTLE